MPILASTSTLPFKWSGRVTIMWQIKSAISLMNSSKGSIPRIERDSGGKLGPSFDAMCPFVSEWAGEGARRGLFRGGGEFERGCVGINCGRGIGVVVM